MEKKNDIAGMGWAFPPTFDTLNNTPVMSDGANTVAQSLGIILGTRQGERPMNPFLGTALQQMLFKIPDNSLLTEMELMIENTLVQFEPRINVNSVDVEVAGGAEGVLMISVDYTLLKTNSRYNKVFPFYLQEGTLLPS